MKIIENYVKIQLFRLNVAFCSNDKPNVFARYIDFGKAFDKLKHKKVFSARILIHLTWESSAREKDILYIYII